mgnify:FL=1
MPSSIDQKMDQAVSYCNPFMIFGTAQVRHDIGTCLYNLYLFLKTNDQSSFDDEYNRIKEITKTARQTLSPLDVSKIIGFESMHKPYEEQIDELVNTTLKQSKRILDLERLAGLHNDTNSKYRWIVTKVERVRPNRKAKAARESLEDTQGNSVTDSTGITNCDSVNNTTPIIVDTGKIFCCCGHILEKNGNKALLCREKYGGCGNRYDKNPDGTRGNLKPKRPAGRQKESHQDDAG